MSKLIKELENDIAALNAKLDRVKLLEDKFELCDEGHVVFSCGSVEPSSNEKTKNFAAINKTEKQAIKRRRMLYLQNVEFQLAEYFNAGEECDWSNENQNKYSIIYDHRIKKHIIAYCIIRQTNASHFVSEEAAEKALTYYIEAVEQYDRGEV